MLLFVLFCTIHRFNNTLVLPEFIGIGLVFVLLFFFKSTNTNTILAFGMVFQYNTIRIAQKMREKASSKSFTYNLLNIIRMWSWSERPLVEHKFN